VIAAIGGRAARRYFLTAERFDAAAALRLGLVHEVVSADALEARGRALLDMLAANAPGAMAAAKMLVRYVAGRPLDDGVIEETARIIADLRAGEEGREGVAAFLEKRTPAWRR
jgi:methylglutaconyl-CoA hydratase